MCANKWLILNFYGYLAMLEIVYLRAKKLFIVNIIIKIRKQYVKPFNCVEKRAQACFKMLSRKCIYESYIFNICVLRGFSIKKPTMVDMPKKPKETKSHIFDIYVLCGFDFK